MKSFTKLLVPVLIAAACACRPATPPIDHEHFERVYRAAKAIQNGTEVGVNIGRFSEMLGALTVEVSIAKQRADSDAEKALVASYTEAVEAYRDSVTVWRWKLDAGVVLAAYRFAELPGLAQKYGQKPQTIGNYNAEELIHRIWSAASPKIESASKELLIPSQVGPRAEHRDGSTRTRGRPVSLESPACWQCQESADRSNSVFCGAQDLLQSVNIGPAHASHKRGYRLCPARPSTAA